MKRLLLFPFSFFVATSANTQPGPPISEPVDANVLNFPDVQTVDGTVSVSNFPQNFVSPFARACNAASNTCSIDLSNLTAMGEVHITHASGTALNVGKTASPRFTHGGVEVLLPPTVNSTDTGNDRDVMYSQSMDLIPVSSLIVFFEPESSNVWMQLSGYVVGSSAANAAVAKDVGIPVTELRASP